MIGAIGIKIGMTRIFDNNGLSIPVTLIKIKKNRITQIKKIKTDGYNAVQMTTGDKKSKFLKKSEIGHFNKAGIKAGSILHEFRLSDYEINNITNITNITISLFCNIKKIDVTSVSKGKGFAGTIKRWNFHMQDASHGNSLSHRAPGSIGQNQTPGKVFKGKKMAGHLGNKFVTIQNLKIINIDIENELLIIKGSIPGIEYSYVIIKPAIKLKGTKNGIINI